jgi:cytoskeletal protein RodZ
MALSQDEQRVLAEIERRLAADDPGLASCLTTFRRPGPATVLRSPRARIIGSLFTVLLVAMVSLMVYAMIPFRTHMPRHNNTPPTASTTANTSTLAATSSQPDRTQQSSAGGGNSAKSTTSQSAANGSAAATAAGQAQQAKGKPTNPALVPEPNLTSP